MAYTTTAGALIESSLRLLGVLQSGESAETQQMSDCLETLNQWIDAQSLSRYMALITQRNVYALVANQSTYTIGPDASYDWDTGDNPRPDEIESAGLILASISPNYEKPLALLTDDQYAAIGLKTYTNPLPTSLYYNHTMPSGTVYLWPTPTDATNTIALYTPLLTAQFADSTTSVALPPGYARMFRTNLAVELAPEYGLDPSARVLEMASASLIDVKAANVPMADLAVDRALRPVQRPTYNIWSDQG